MLKEKPDLTKQLTQAKVVPGLKVDLVPATGSVNVAALATRSATGSIVNETECESPLGVTPRVAIAGNGCVVIELDEIHSSGLILPHYKHESKDATLSLFKHARAVVPVGMLRKHVNSDNI